MKTALLLTLLAVPAFAQIEARYDKFKDASIVTYSAGRVNPSKGNGTLRLYAYFTFKGERLSGEPNYWLMFAGNCRGLCFSANTNLIFLAESSRLEFGRGTHNYGTRQVFSERISFAIDKDQLAKIANSSEASFQLGTFEAELSEKQRKGLKDLLEYRVK